METHTVNFVLKDLVAVDDALRTRLGRIFKDFTLTEKEGGEEERKTALLVVRQKARSKSEVMMGALSAIRASGLSVQPEGLERSTA